MTNSFLCLSDLKTMPCIILPAQRKTTKLVVLLYKRKQTQLSASISPIIQTIHPPETFNNSGGTMWLALQVKLRYQNVMDGDEVGFKKLVVSYHWPTNLGNLFSVRNIHGRGREVSSYLTE